MTSHVPVENILKMNNILDQELEFLGIHNFHSSNRVNKQSKPSYDTRSSLLSSTNSNSNANTLRSSLPHVSPPEPKPKEKSGPIKVWDTQQIVKAGPTDKSIRLQKELIELQSKVIYLEKKVNRMNTPTSLPRPERNYVSSTDTSFHNTADYTRSINMAKESPRKTPIPGKSSLRTSSILKATEPESYRESTGLHRNHLTFSRGSLLDDQPKVSHRTPSQKKVHLSLTRKSSKEDDEIQTYQYSSNHSEKKSHRSTRGSAKRRRTSSFSYQTHAQDIIVLNKQIMKMKEEYNEDRAAVRKERIRGQELIEELKKLDKKTTKMANKVQSKTKFSLDHEKLFDSFNKSEEIRSQQRKLIDSLHYEIRLLKENRCDLSKISRSEKSTIRSSHQLKKRDEGKGKRKIGRDL